MSEDIREHDSGAPGEDDRWLRSVVENSSEIVTIVDPDGTLRYANPAWERALGYDPDRAIGTMNVLDYVHPEDLPQGRLVAVDGERWHIPAGRPCGRGRGGGLKGRHRAQGG